MGEISTTSKPKFDKNDFKTDVVNGIERGKN